ncbi:MAG: methylenetetrahydrofolate reductase [NAD(P)H] [Magnetovibrio sp.]|nr:methylenetetrahydrofolate reductase [NAD(P)H] [Magnetovibrio sp.]
MSASPTATAHRLTPPKTPAGLAISRPQPDDVEVSFEMFPPDGLHSTERFWACLARLAPLDPAYISVTYGAGGSTSERSLNTVRRIQQDTALKPAAHLTCVGADRGRVDDVAREFWDMGVRHIVALRGDPPKDAGPYRPHPDGYAYAADLIAGLKRIGDFRISAAAYPEVHPEAGSADADLDHLKRKVDAGADALITQYFFDVDIYFRFLDRVRGAGIDVPVIPGILPVTNFRQVANFSVKCGATVPGWLADLFDGLDGDPEACRLVAASVAAEQCRALYAGGVDRFHFYTMNRAELCFAICHMLGVRPEPLGRAA